MSNIQTAPSSDLIGATSPSEAATPPADANLAMTAAASSASSSANNATSNTTTATTISNTINATNTSTTTTTATAALLLAQKRGSMGSINGVMLAGNNSNNIIARRPGRMNHPGTSKKEGCGKQDHRAAAAADAGQRQHASHASRHPIESVVVPLGSHEEEVEMSEYCGECDVDGDVDMAMEDDDDEEDVDVRVDVRENDDDGNDDDDSSSISEDDSLDDYRSAFSSQKDDLFWAEESSQGGSSLRGAGSSSLGGREDRMLDILKGAVRNSDSMEGVASSSSSSPMMESRVHSLVGWNVPKQPAIGSSSSSASSSSQSASQYSVPPSPTTFQTSTATTTSSSPRQTNRRNHKFTRAMQRIVSLNSIAVEFYRAGEYDATLEALREAEGRRRKLVQTLNLEQGWEAHASSGFCCQPVNNSNNIIFDNTTSAATEAGSGSAPLTLCQEIEDTKMGVKMMVDAIPTSSSSGTFSSLAGEVKEEVEEEDDRSSTCTTPGVARTSYIYQRMDFDEGMHSFANAETMDASKFWIVGPDQMAIREKTNASSNNNKWKWCEISPVVEATLVFNVGQVHRRRGEFDAAAKSYDRALEILKSALDATNGRTSRSEVILGKGIIPHPIIIPILHNVGQLQYRRGDLAIAMTTYTSALKHAQMLYGPRHVHAASALNCLGVLHYHANSSESDDSNGNNDSSSNNNNNNDKSSSEKTKKNTNNTKEERSSTRKAMELFRQALSIRTERLGSDHVDVATTLNNIGRIHVQQDEFDQALHFYEDALVIRRERLGTNSLDYAATAFNAGQSLHQKGDLDHAAELYREFLRVALMKFGHSHRDVAVVLSGIAQIHQEKREYDKALELYEESLCAGRAALGEYHSEIAMLLNRMGNFYFERERLDDALRCYRRGLRIEKRVLPPDHPNIVVTLSNLGEIHRQRNEWDDAANMYCDALEILRKKHENHVDIASTLNTIGLIHDQRGDTSLSLRYLQEALLMRRKLLGDDHIDVSATLVYIGTILYRKSVFSVAMELFSEALRIRRTVLGRDHRDVAFALYNIALVHQQRGCYEQAIEYYAETLRVEKVVLGDRHRDVSMTLFKLGEVNKAAGDLEEALKCFQDSLEIERSLDNNSSSNTEGGRRPQQTSSDPAAMARTLNEIGNIHLARGDVVPMMDAFNEASRLYRTAGLSPNNVVVSGHLYALEISCPEAAPAA